MKKIINLLTNNQLAVGLILLNAVLLIIYTPMHYYFEMFQSLAFQFMLLTLPLLFLFVWKKKWVGILSSTLAIFLLSIHLPLLPNVHKEAGNMSIAHFNVLKYNEEYNATIHAALDSKADFISFNEVNPNWSTVLEKELKETYPYYKIQEENNSFGIAVFSKTPLQDIEIHYWGSNFIPTITGSSFFAGTKVKFVAAHTVPPTNKEAFSIRNNHLVYIKEYLKQVDGPKIVLGDLNAVSWSEVLINLREENKLLDSRTSWLPTFPSWFQLAAIPIDHIFYSKELTCTNFYTIKTTNSDHYGIVGEYLITENLSSLK